VIPDLDRIENKIDKIDQRLDKVDQHLAVYNAQLEIHIKRTTQIEEELKPIELHVASVRNFFKWVAGGIAGAIALLELLRLIK
jgi:archaellum component FlaC